MRETGTAHLFSISGMHVGIVAASCCLFVLCAFSAPLFLFSGMVNRFPVYQILLPLIVLVTAVYATIADWQLPVQRAWLFIFLLSVTVLMKRYILLWQSLVITVAIIIVISPFSVFGASLYLSAGAVALLGFISWRYHTTGKAFRYRLVQLLFVQSLLSVLLVFFTVLFFGTASLLTAPINMIAIPIITLLVPFFIRWARIY